MSKKLLLLSLSTGAGHVRAAQAIEEECKKKYPHVEVLHLDVVQLVRPLTKVFAFDWYDTLLISAPGAWDIIYKLSNIRLTQYVISIITRTIARIDGRTIEKHITDFDPDIIISTHFISSHLVERMKRKKRWGGQLMTVVTDFSVHHLWVGRQDTTYTAATEDVRKLLENAGIDKEHILVSGIPVSRHIQIEKERTALQKKHKIDPSQPLVVVVGGGTGLIPIDTLVKRLFEENCTATVIAIAGKNKALFKRLAEINVPPKFTFIPIGWTDEMDEYLRMADAVITKPGGMTTAECIALGTPIIAYTSVGGQERGNVEHIVNNGFGISIERSADLPTEIFSHLPPKFAPQKNDATRIILEFFFGADITE